MNIRIFAWTLGALVVMGVTTGCALLQEIDEPATVSEPAPETNPDPDGEKLLAAFVANDSAAFEAVLPEELQKQFGAKEFAAAHTNLEETLGKPVSYHFETTLEHPLVKVSIWKVRFERTGSDGKLIHQEVLFRVISGNLDGKSRVVSFNFL